AQGRGQGHGPAGGLPPAVTTQHGGGDHGPGDHGQANKPSVHNNSATSVKNDLATRLGPNTKLTSRLQKLMPGVDLPTAAMEFKNLGQLIAAIHVSKNLDIPFDQLKAAMIAGDQKSLSTSTDDHKSLGDAIHQLRPELKTDAVKIEVKTAEDEAKDDIKTT